jgi:pimeloyl-ACP methyl ester carboxylesterase
VRVIRPRAPINVVAWGSGEPAVLVHGSLSWGTFAFREQRPLARKRMLLLPDRRCYGASPPATRADFEVDADDVAGLLDEPAHLVGHSYGALVALLIAVRLPEAVRTLTLVEPAAFALARGDPAVEELIATLAELRASAAGLPAGEFVLRYLEALGYRRGADMPGHLRLSAKAARAARATMAQRPPWEAEIALDVLTAADLPALVASGRWNNLAIGETALGRRAFGAVGETLVDALGARRVTIDGWAHGCQYSGAPFNKALESFWGKTTVDARRGRPTAVAQRGCGHARRGGLRGAAAPPVRGAARPPTPPRTAEPQPGGPPRRSRPSSGTPSWYGAPPR